MSDVSNRLYNNMNCSTVTFAAVEKFCYMLERLKYPTIPETVTICSVELISRKDP